MEEHLLNNMLIKEQFFPTTIYAKDLQLDNQVLTNHIIEWSKSDKGINKTNVNGWHSTTDMHKKPEYKLLIDELYKMQHEIYKEELLDNEPFLGNMWANVNYQGGYNAPHIHANSMFSGVYYVKSEPNSGRLVCDDPRPGIQHNIPMRKEGELPKHLWRVCEIEPIPGRLVMFPAWLWHRVSPNLSKDIRISISFNFLQKGLMA